MDNNIRRIREAKGYSLEKVAALAGTDRSQIHRLEKGQRRLTQQWMERIAEALGCSPSDLIDRALALKEEGGAFRGLTRRKADSGHKQRLVMATRLAMELAEEGRLEEHEVEGLAIRAADAAEALGTEVTRHLVEHLHEAGASTDVD